MITSRALIQCARIVNINARRSSALQVVSASRLLKVGPGNSSRLLPPHGPTNQPSVVLTSSQSSLQRKWLTDLPKRVKADTEIASVVGGASLVLRQLYKVLTQDRSILDLPQQPLHYVQPRPDRVEELEEMFQLLQKRNHQGVANTVYVTGMPAEGKTELARQFGEEFYHKNKGYVNKKLVVGTLNAKSYTDLLQSYSRLAQVLGCVSDEMALAAYKGDPKTLKVLSNAIGEELKKRPGWLLIVDNLTSNVKMGDSWNSIWPQPGDKRWGKGCVLVTTQYRELVDDISPFVKELPLSDGMPESDAAELLKELSGCSDEGAEDVVNSPSVIRVPISVASAGVYIKKMKTSGNPFKDYLKLLEKGAQEKSEKLLQKKQAGVYPYTRKVATTLAAEQMAKDNPILYKVFTLLASCDQSLLPMSVVARMLEVQPDISTELESVYECALLSSPTQEDIEVVSVHQLTREVFKDLFLGDTSTGTQQKRNDLLSHIMDCLIEEYAMAQYSNTASSYRMRMLLLPHMEALLQVPSTVSGFQFDADREMRLYSWLGEGYILVERYSEAKEVFERAQRVCEREGRKGTRQDTAIARKLGNTYRALAMYKESESILKAVLATCEEQHGEDSVEVADALNVLGSVNFDMGQFKGSRECWERALTIFQQAYGRRHSSVGGVLNNLGNTWLELGDPAKSKELLEEALVIREELYGPDHPEIALTYTNLGNAYTDLGDYCNSIKMYKQSLETLKRIYGEYHSGDAMALVNLSQVYYHLGDVCLGKECANEALKRNEAIYGPRHPDVANTLAYLGLNHMTLEEFDDAQECLQRTAEILNEKFVPNRIPMHALYSKVQIRLGEVTRLAGSLEDARQILETALKTQESTISSDHGAERRLVRTCWELGKVYRELGYLTQSVHTLRRAVDMRKQLNYNNLWPDFPKVLFIQADLARALWYAGELKASTDMMQEALTETQSTFTNPHVLAMYSSTLTTRGLMLRDSGELTQAREYLEKSLHIQKELQLPCNLLKAETIGILGTVLHRLGTPTSDRNPITFLRLKYRRFQARKHLDSALEVMKKVRYSHPITSTILAAIGRIHVETREFPSARNSLEEALRIQSECCGLTVHPDIALYHTLLAEITNGESATQHHQKADEIYRALLKREGVGKELPILQEWRKGLLTKR